MGTRVKTFFLCKEIANLLKAKLTANEWNQRSPKPGRLRKGVNEPERPGLQTGMGREEGRKEITKSRGVCGGKGHGPHAVPTALPESPFYLAFQTGFLCNSPSRESSQ